MPVPTPRPTRRMSRALHACVLAAAWLPFAAVAQVPPQQAARPTAPAAAQADVIPAPAPVPAAAKRPVESKGDLPAFTYPLQGTATALLQSDDATFNAFAARVGADVDGVLAGYDIRDAATLRTLLQTRADVQMLIGQDAAAVATFARIRELEDKPDRRLTARVFDEALLRARAQVGGDAGDAALAAAFAREYAAMLAPLPWEVVGARVMQTRAGMVFQTEAIQLGTLAAFVEPGVAKSGQLGSENAAMLLDQRVALRLQLPVREASMKAMADYIAANRREVPDIWQARDVDLAGREGLTPVPVAIWDEGVDLALFPGRVFVDPDPDPFHGPNGIAFDLEFEPERGALIPLTDAQRATYAERLALMKGLNDMSMGLDTPETGLFVREVGRLSAAEVPQLMEEMTFYAAFYTHGTHVAGIAAAGNPAIRLAYGRQNWDWRNVPAPPTEARTARMARNFQAFVDWYRSRGIRVVNMSWGGVPAYVETALEANGIGEDAEERKAIARRHFGVGRDALEAAIRSAPEILFVNAAGNSNSDATFDETMPSSFVLPNLLVVGAVDKSGNEAAFTSYGPTVKVYANGQQVEAVVPGGRKMHFSGTSMASPQVANLAAKLLAIEPSLQPAEVIALIVEGATPTADGRRRNIDPKRSVALLDARRAQAGAR